MFSWVRNRRVTIAARRAIDESERKRGARAPRPRPAFLLVIALSRFEICVEDRTDGSNYAISRMKHL